MSKLKKTTKQAVHRLGHSLESRFDTLRYDLKKRLKYDHSLQVVPYNGYGNEKTLFIEGRVLEEKGDIDQHSKESLWKNLVAAYQRFESDEVPDLQLIARLHEIQVNTQTDEEGYFSVSLPVPESLDRNQLWHKIDIEIPPQPMLASPVATTSGKVLLPPADCDFGIISDIDDTIMVTNATSLIKMARLTFMHSPASRLPFAGVAEFYQALVQGASSPRPIFYVSSSPWNLYDFLLEFKALNNIPEGPLLLRDFGLNSEHLFQSSHHQHKLQQISQVMDTYPDLPFILIGDSGQHDPEIYAEIVTNRPEQVKAIYIRDVSADSSRTEAITYLSERVKQDGIDLVLTADTQVARAHALAKGYIRPTSPE